MINQLNQAANLKLIELGLKAKEKIKEMKGEEPVKKGVGIMQVLVFGVVFIGIMVVIFQDTLAELIEQYIRDAFGAMAGDLF